MGKIYCKSNKCIHAKTIEKNFRVREYFSAKFETRTLEYEKLFHILQYIFYRAKLCAIQIRNGVFLIDHYRHFPFGNYHFTFEFISP